MVTQQEILRAAELIRAGGLVVFPTETVYGLGADALNADAVERIFIAKGRPATSPLIVHVASVEMARTVVSEWPEEAGRLAALFWPGPLTLVLPKRPHVPDRVTGGLATVGIRMPRHPVALALIEAVGGPVAAPSANRFTELSPTSAAHVAGRLEVDMILDAGPASVGIESTVLSLATLPPTLLRPGMISRSQLESVLGVVMEPEAGPGDGAHPSPGMHHRHYSPRTGLKVMPFPPAGNVAWVWWNHSADTPRTVKMPSDSAGYAAALYGILHLLDEENWELIAVETPPQGSEWDGVRDRLRRASQSEPETA